MMKPNLPIILSFNGGYVDTAGFLMLEGLFTAHVTGNFVMIGDALAHGASGVVAKLLALPVFCLTILILQSIALRVGATSARAVRAMLIAKFLLLTAAAIAAIGFGDFSNPDGFPLISTGMLLVAGMAIQNAAHRLHLSSTPPTTLMTGTTTQVMLDLASLLYDRSPERPESVKPRLVRLIVTVTAFALGCALAALATIQIGMWAFVLPPILALIGMAVHEPDQKSV
ncbi:MAG: DUF1275 family protein [Alphaproteobacteria bacterium]